MPAADDDKLISSLNDAIYKLNEKKKHRIERDAKTEAYDFKEDFQNSFMRKKIADLTNKLNAAADAAPAGIDRNALKGNIQELEAKLTAAATSVLQDLAQTRFENNKREDFDNVTDELDSIQKALGASPPGVGDIKKAVEEIKTETLNDDIQKMQNSANRVGTRLQADYWYQRCQHYLGIDLKTIPGHTGQIWKKVSGPTTEKDINNDPTKLAAIRTAQKIQGLAPDEKANVIQGVQSLGTAPAPKMLESFFDGGYGLYHRDGSNWMLDYKEGNDGKPSIEAIYIGKEESIAQTIINTINDSDPNNPRDIMQFIILLLMSLLVWGAASAMEKDPVDKDAFMARLNELAMFKLAHEEDPSVDLPFKDDFQFTRPSYDKVEKALNYLKDLKDERGNTVLMDLKLTEGQEKMMMKNPVRGKELLKSIQDWNKLVAEGRRGARKEREASIAGREAAQMQTPMSKATDDERKAANKVLNARTALHELEEKEYKYNPNDLGVGINVEEANLNLLKAQLDHTKTEIKVIQLKETPTPAEQKELVAKERQVKVESKAIEIAKARVELRKLHNEYANASSADASGARPPIDLLPPSTTAGMPKFEDMVKHAANFYMKRVDDPGVNENQAGILDAVKTVIQKNPGILPQKPKEAKPDPAVVYQEDFDKAELPKPDSAPGLGHGH